MSVAGTHKVEYIKYTGEFIQYTHNGIKWVEVKRTVGHPVGGTAYFTATLPTGSLYRMAVKNTYPEGDYVPPSLGYDLSEDDFKSKKNGP